MLTSTLSYPSFNALPSCLTPEATSRRREGDYLGAWAMKTDTVSAAMQASTVILHLNVQPQASFTKASKAKDSLICVILEHSLSKSTSCDVRPCAHSWP